MSAVNEWKTAWNRLGVIPPNRLLDQLVAAYEEPHRSDHNRRHLDECFDQLDLVQPLLKRPAEVGLVLWFHDAINDPKRTDNELRSAEWATRAIREAGLPEDSARVVHNLILATKHDAPPDIGDERYLLDVDLSILGSDETRFDEYEDQVREEYAFVTDDAFRSGRAPILRGLLARPWIYQTGPYRQRFEGQARVNLERSLVRLGA